MVEFRFSVGTGFRRALRCDEALSNFAAERGVKAYTVGREAGHGFVRFVHRVSFT
jgi:hypothetical protein